MKLFDLNSPVMSALNKLADIVICNILFCLCSLPILTAGASLSALYTCMQSLVEDTEDDNTPKQFFRAFRDNWKQATVLWVFCLGAALFLAGFYWAISLMPEGLKAGYQVSFLVVCLLFLLGFQYIFPLQARYQLSTKHILKNAWLLGVAALPWTLCSIIVTGGAVWVTFFMNPESINIAVFLSGFALFGVITYINSFFFRQSFRKLQGTSES
jgi:uncharacterized membrane protein YesL